MTIELKDILEAQKKIESVIHRTPLELSRYWTEFLGLETYFKFENLQRTGSFKIRGALNKLMSLTEEQKQKGIVAASAGNHAQGVAFSATHLGAQSHIVMPIPTPIVKTLATQHYGANIIHHGQFFDESFAYAKQLEREKGYTFVHPFEDPQIIAGQGTIGLEIISQIPDLDSIVIPIGGGGLISGIATAIKSKRPQCKVFGAVAANTPGMAQLFHHKKYEPLLAQPSIADGIAVKTPSQTMFKNYISRLVDDVYAVKEDDIAEAMVFLLERSKTVVEGSGAVALAAAAKGNWDLGKKTAIILSGGNVDLNLMANVIEKGLSQRGRIARFSVVVRDKPGTLNLLTNIIANEGANILEVHHDRLRPTLELSETAIDFLVETKNEAHLQSILEKVQASSAVLKID